MHMCERLLTLTVFMETRASNSSCSDTRTLATGNWLFYLEGGTYLLHFLPFIVVHRLCIQSFILVPCLFIKTFL